jgi:hypothetical protein
MTYKLVIKFEISMKNNEKTDDKSIITNLRSEKLSQFFDKIN